LGLKLNLDYGNVPLAKYLIVVVSAISSRLFFSFGATIPMIISSAVIGASGFFEDRGPALVLACAGDGFEAAELSDTDAVYGGGESFVTFLLPEANAATEAWGPTS
jgi:hypothetical protein